MVLISFNETEHGNLKLTCYILLRTIISNLLMKAYEVLIDKYLLSEQMYC